MKAVVDEMLGLQYIMANVAYGIRVRRAAVSDAFLDEILPILECYQGPDASPRLVEGIRVIRSYPEAERAALDCGLSRPNVGISLRQYSVPLLAAQMAELAICSLDFQRAVLHIRNHLDLFNQFVLYTQSLFEKTFDKPTPGDWKALATNQEEAYHDAGTRAEIIIRAIGDLRKQYNSAG
jgi:hypothetical protein